MQKAYLDCEFDINNVNDIDEIECILDDAGVEREDIILYGSSIMALAGIRSNNDLEFIPHPDKRDRFKQLAEEVDGAYINENHQICFPGDIHTSWPNRFGIFGWEDEHLFDNDQFYIECEGYKFLKLELLVSLKGSLRRPKDIEDLEILEKEGYIGGSGWNWDLVRRVPPWNREDDSPSLWKLGQHSLRRNGVVETFKKGVPFLSSQVLNKDPTKEISNYIDKYKYLLRLDSEITQEVGLYYPAPELFARQMTKDGFIRNDFIAAVLALEEHPEFKDWFSNKTTIHDGITISHDGKIINGVNRLASRWVEQYERSSIDPEEIVYPVNSVSNKDQCSKGRKWAEKEFSSEGVSELTARRNQILADSGVFFYMIIWPLGKEQHDEIADWIGKRAKVISSLEFSLEGSIEKFAKDIHSIDKRPMEWEKERKVSRISSAGSDVRVLSLEIPEPNFRLFDTQRVSDRLYSLKQECRQEFNDKVENYEYGCLLHATDNYKHNRHVRKILLNL